MRLEIGKEYTNNDKERLTIVSCHSDCYLDNEGCFYRPNGEIYSSDREFSKYFDLQEIEEQPDNMLGI